VDPNYAVYFADRLRSIEEFSRQAPNIENFGLVQPAVDSGRDLAASRNKTLRSDAQLFLLMAFQEFVSRPVQAVRPSVSLPDLAATIAHDVELIIERAIPLTVPNDDISVHNIVDATSGSWPSLQSASWQLWDT
jgi:hypothetical protein